MRWKDHSFIYNKQKYTKRPKRTTRYKERKRNRNGKENITLASQRILFFSKTKNDTKIISQNSTILQ